MYEELRELMGEIGDRNFGAVIVWKLGEVARERGDLYAAMNLSTYSLSVVRLAADEPDAAREEIRRVIGQWSREGYHVQHNDQVWASVQIDLYQGDGAAAWERITRHWPTLT